MQETDKTTKPAKTKRSIDWKAIAIDSGSLVLQGALMALGNIFVQKSVQALTARTVSSSSDNVLHLKKVATA